MHYTDVHKQSRAREVHSWSILDGVVDDSFVLSLSTREFVLSEEIYRVAPQSRETSKNMKGIKILKKKIIDDRETNRNELKRLSKWHDILKIYRTFTAANTSTAKCLGIINRLSDIYL